MGKKKGNLATLLVLFIVVFLPLGSLFYLQKGFHYHKEIWDNMKTYGDFPSFTFSESTANKPITDDILKGRISMIGFYNNQNEKQFLEMFSRFYDQFKQDETMFIGVDLDGGFDKKAILDDEHLPISIDFILVNGGDDAQSLIQELKYPDFSKPKDEKGHYQRSNPTQKELKEYPIIVLVDEYGELRNYIQWNSKKGMHDAVEQMAILITHQELGDKRTDEK